MAGHDQPARAESRYPTKPAEPISPAEQPSGRRPSNAIRPAIWPAPAGTPQGTLILIFGIVGIFISLFAAIAWYLGANAIKEIRATGIRYSNESNIDTGRLLGKIVTIIALVGLAIVFLIWFVFGVLLVGVRLSQGL
jgi:hypothetical protein